MVLWPGRGGKMNESYCLSSPWPGFNFQPWRSISRNISLADHTQPTCPEPAWQEMAPSPFNGTTQPVDSGEEGRSPATDTTADERLKKMVLHGPRPFFLKLPCSLDQYYFNLSYLF